MVSETFFASEVSPNNNSLMMISANRLFFFMIFPEKDCSFMVFGVILRLFFNVVVIAMAFILYNLTF